MQKKVTEQYTVDAISFSEAERRIVEEITPYTSGDFEITNVKKAAYNEIFFSDRAEDDRWYKAKLQFTTINERTEKVMRASATFLVQAATLDGAVKNINEVMNSTMIDYEKSNIAETRILDVFQHQKKESDNGNEGE